MRQSIKSRFSEQEKQKLVQIARHFGASEVEHAAGNPDSARLWAVLEEISGDENIGRNPVFGQAGVNQIGGSMLLFLLDTVVTLANRLEESAKTVQELRQQIVTDKDETRDLAINIAEACEAVTAHNDVRTCINRLGELLHQPEDLSISSFLK